MQSESFHIFSSVIPSLSYPLPLSLYSIPSPLSSSLNHLSVCPISISVQHCSLSQILRFSSYFVMHRCSLNVASFNQSCPFLLLSWPQTISLLIIVIIIHRITVSLIIIFSLQMPPGWLLPLLFSLSSAHIRLSFPPSFSFSDALINDDSSICVGSPPGETFSLPSSYLPSSLFSFFTIRSITSSIPALIPSLTFDLIFILPITSSIPFLPSQCTLPLFTSSLTS